MTETTRLCRQCGESKPIESYAKCGNYRGRVCRSCYHRNWNSNPDNWSAKVADNASRKLWSKYGMTLEDYELMLESQGGRCAICGGEQIRAMRMHIDHCHSTGMVRGLLCEPCNHGLGKFGDSPERLASAIEYLTWFDR